VRAGPRLPVRLHENEFLNPLGSIDFTGIQVSFGINCDRIDPVKVPAMRPLSPIDPARAPVLRYWIQIMMIV